MTDVNLSLRCYRIVSSFVRKRYAGLPARNPRPRTAAQAVGYSDTLRGDITRQRPCCAPCYNVLRCGVEVAGRTESERAREAAEGGESAHVSLSLYAAVASPIYQGASDVTDDVRGILNLASSQAPSPSVYAPAAATPPSARFAEGLLQYSKAIQRTQNGVHSSRRQKRTRNTRDIAKIEGIT